ncbi:hypothetical protein FIBSPDRAFT_860436 [Athelia psychrophila]|uniref:Uncharacterized protein n=1 Tax=Athelia psychrophila TaxID=1759441 RepID=A0A166K4E6_9AGAM|nr:hypothetical protein FIBSPDRAFT_860436 [Fibularhizoctonia sp. CBS 109695]
MPLVLVRCLRQLFLRPTITTNVSNTCTKTIVLIAPTAFRPPPPPGIELPLPGTPAAWARACATAIATGNANADAPPPAPVLHCKTHAFTSALTDTARRPAAMGPVG